MSLKDWKNKELSENLGKKWGFKMDLTKLNEAGAAPDSGGSRSGPSSYEEEMMQMMQARDAAKKKKGQKDEQVDEAVCGEEEEKEELMEEKCPKCEPEPCDCPKNEE